MKTFLRAALGILTITAAIVFNSCSEDKCKTITCAYGGVCETDGSCTCPVGYEGERCETISRDKFKGVWTVTEDGSASNARQYSVSVEDGINVSEVIIRNFYGEFNSIISANIVLDTIYIPEQQYQVGDLIRTVVGKGYIVPENYYGAHGQLFLHYKVSDNNGVVDDFGFDGDNDPSEWIK